MSWLRAGAVLGLVTACSAPPPGHPTVTLPLLVALSDGDHSARTYVDGVLTPAELGHRDLLTATRIEDRMVTTTQVPVSNSVTAAPEVLALSPDGATAFVTERLGGRRPGDTRAEQLPAGNRLFAVDISDPDRLRLTAQTGVVSFPEALAVHPGGSHVAVVSNDPAAAVLQIIPWTGRAFGEPSVFDLADIGVTGSGAGPRGGVTATNVQWHPDGGALAVNINTQNRVVFLTVDTSGTVTVRPWGAPVTTGSDPFVGRFTPDGRHYVTSDWGRDLAASEVARRLPRGPSRLTVISTGEIGGAPPAVVASATSDKSAEGLAISPDGRWVATVNMRGTALPPGVDGHDDAASVSLLRRNPDSGALTKIGDYPLRGVLPEGGTFDPSGRYFIATVFEARPGSSEGAGLQIYRVGSDPDPGLSAVQRIPLPHGVHHVAVG